MCTVAPNLDFYWWCTQHFFWKSAFSLWLLVVQNLLLYFKFKNYWWCSCIWCLAGLTPLSFSIVMFYVRQGSKKVNIDPFSISLLFLVGIYYMYGPFCLSRFSIFVIAVSFIHQRVWDTCNITYTSLVPSQPVRTQQMKI